ncbi:endonuclease domain-containing protein [Aquimarina sp. W85]|uniref:endonuclease domain-containing protein n=1 Tax=Aquimarina rhodophyticola TaxID=3342246 RepID=UPI00366FA7B3
MNTLSTHIPVKEHVVKYSLNNTIGVLDQLALTLSKKGIDFKRNHSIANYTFDFYNPKLRLAIEVDGYAHEFSDIMNQDTQKKLLIPSLNIHVLRFTDHQILVDSEEIIRAIKTHASLNQQVSYVD